MWALFTIIIVIVLAWRVLHVFRWPLFNLGIRIQRRKGDLSEHSIKIDDHDIVYLEGGTGEPLLLLHGFGANKDNWLQIAPLLAPHFRLIIPDLPGFGDSTRKDESRYAAADQIVRLHGMINALELGAVHLGGNSMGGYLAGLYAAQCPAHVKSQWLLAPAGVISAEPSEFFQMVENGDNPLLVNTPADFKRLLQMCFTKIPYIPQAFQRCICERNIREQKFNEKIFGDLLIDPPALEVVLNGSKTKTQILWGDEDRILHASGASLLGNAIANAETIVMKKMGHCPMLERPRETAELYLKFQGLS